VEPRGTEVNGKRAPMGSGLTARLRGGPSVSLPRRGNPRPRRELRRPGPATDTTTPPCHSRGSACIHISTVVHRV